MLIALRRRAIDNIFASDYAYILKKEIGYINNIINRETTHVIEAFDSFVLIFSHFAYALVYILLSLVLSVRLTFMVVILAPILIVLMRRINRLTGQASVDLSRIYARFQSILIQALSKIKYLKSTFSSARISKIIDNENRNAGLQTFKVKFFQLLARYILEPLFIVAIIGFLAYNVVILKGSVNEVLFLSFLFLQIARQFINAQSSYRLFVSSIGSIETLNAFEMESLSNRENLHLDGLSPDLTGPVDLKDVTVIFPNGKKALDGVNIRIKPMSITAFVGQSASGKSTIANIITGILRPTDGEAVIGGIGYDRINLRTLREGIGYVTQEDVIFNASIKDNITLWGNDADENKLCKVMELVDMACFVNDLPEKENSMLGDNGLDISGGQRQRIAIARELYKDTKILILDEATSSLDGESENQIYKNLKEFKGKRTMVVIAHRLSTVGNADYIYVIDKGKVIEAGTYDELHGKRGAFTKMVEDQKLVHI